MSTGTKSTSTYQIEPLHGAANYNVWHIKIRHILIDLGLFKYVESMAPSLAANKSAIKIWNKKNHKALSTISLCVDDSALVYIAGHCLEGANIEEHIYTLCELHQ